MQTFFGSSSISSKTITTQKAAELLDLTVQHIRRLCLKGKFRYTSNSSKGGNGGKSYLIYVDSLPLNAQKKYFDEIYQRNVSQPHQESLVPDSKITESNMLIISGMKEAERSYAFEWLDILSKTNNMTVNELKVFVKTYIPIDKRIKVSRATIYDKRRKYNEWGLSGLCPDWGKNKGKSKVSDIAFDRFCSTYMREGGPSIEVCHQEAFGYMKKIDPTLRWKDFPSAKSFLRRLENEYSRAEIDLCRKGEQNFKRVYEYFIPRDWSMILAGAGYVCDHHILDVRTITNTGEKVRPWLTAWRDLRSKKMLSWLIHKEAPNSDHVFHSFYLAVTEHGLPDFVLLDNRKDFKVHDFSGVKKHKVWDETSKMKASALLVELKVQTIFAIEYNAQAKPIERDFKEIINSLVKLLKGYTGSTPSERPEQTRKDEKAGNLLPFEWIDRICDEYFTTVFNKKPSNGDLLKGMCPDEAWEKYRRNPIRKISENSCNYLLMRTSKEYTISSRYGIIDKSLGFELIYWNDKFHELHGLRVYMKRNIKKYQEAWIYRCDDNTPVCKAETINRVAGFATTDLQKEDLKKGMARKRQSLKLARRVKKHIAKELDPFEIIENQAIAVREISGYIPSERQNESVVIQTTIHDKAVMIDKELQKDFTGDITGLASKIIPEKKVAAFQYEINEERRKTNCA